MIILKDVPFEQRGRLLRDSLCGILESASFQAVVDQHPRGIGEGLRKLDGVLRALYSDVAHIEGKDDEAWYANLIATMWFLYAVAGSGTLVPEDSHYSLRIGKARLAKQYKKGSLSRRRRHLERHGFSVRSLSDQGEASSMSRASELSLSYGGGLLLVSAPSSSRRASRPWAMGSRPCTAARRPSTTSWACS